MDKVKWKIKLYKNYKKNPYIDYNFKYLIKDLLYPSIRKENYKNYLNSMHGVAKNLYHIDFSVNTPSGTLEEVFIERIYTEHSDFLPEKKDVIIDAGAQYGDYTLLCSKYFSVKKIYAFEPLINNFNVLMENIKLNSVNNVEVYNIALGISEGIKNFHIDENMINKFHGKNTISVAIKSIDSFKFDNVNILKIDVEGSEYDLIRGAIKTIKNSHPKIIMEIHSKDLKVKCLKFLERYGYKNRYTENSRKNVNNHMDLVQNLFLY
ncbi:MAG: FkbM family methyltransferase [Candidatus Thermoplasmatota archaeon]|nr:FkbM family methyltransferase [Candidatus Thermoplasmatota archaeon]MCL5963970.1 FkbM family methyltransferase [Candidatus Thermoplasmatota archaeon]